MNELPADLADPNVCWNRAKILLYTLDYYRGLVAARINYVKSLITEPGKEYIETTLDMPVGYRIELICELQKIFAKLEVQGEVSHKSGHSSLAWYEIKKKTDIPRLSDITHLRLTFIDKTQQEENKHK